jgi:hypothetical protein
MTHYQEMSPIEMELIKWLNLQIHFFGWEWIKKTNNQLATYSTYPFSQGKGSYY